jgi:hypothetical protein
MRTMTPPNDAAGLSRRDLCRVGAGALAAAASTSTATARGESPVRDDGSGVRMQTDGNQTGGNQSGTNDSGGNQTGANETGGNPGTPQDQGNVGEGNEGDEPPAERAGTDTLALFGVAAVLAFLSPVALVVLMYRHTRREEEEF